MATNRRDTKLDGELIELLDDHTIEQLLVGRLDGERADLQALSSFIRTLRSMPTRVPAVVRPELVAIFETGQTAGEVPLVAADKPKSQASRRRRMLETLSAFVATLAGKVVLGTAAVAASVGGAHAAGVVDVPGLPDQASTTVIDAPAVVDTPDQADSSPDVETGQPADPGVDGTSVSERATSGEPQEDGKAFGTSVADEATDGTPAEGLPGNGGDAAEDRQPDTPAGGAETADEHKPDSPPAGGGDIADEYRPDSTPTDQP
jgi:hypothetical protein